MGVFASKCCDELDIECCERPLKKPPDPPKDHRFCTVNCFELFALSVEPGNAFLSQRAAEVDRLRAAGEMTCPSTIADELAANPFLRTGSSEIRKNLGMEGATDAQVFAELRARKNTFR